MRAFSGTVDAEIAHVYQLMRKALREKGDHRWAEFLYKRLRKEFHIDIIPEIDLPWPHRFVHPLGTVLGRATYAPHLVVYQGVSVGSTVERERPTFTGPCVLFPHSGVIGPAVVGKNVFITAGTIVEARSTRQGRKPLVIPDNVIVSRSLDVDYPYTFASTSRSILTDFFAEPAKPSPESLAALGVGP